MSTACATTRTGRIGVTLLAFLGGAVALYALTCHRALQTPDHVACAFLWERTGSQAVEPGTSPARDATAIEADILSGMEQVAERPSPIPPWSSPGGQDTSNDPPIVPQPETPIREYGNVGVEVHLNPRQGQSLITIRVTDRNASRAVLLANQLAGEYVKRRGAATDAQAEQDSLKAQADAEQARHAYLLAREQLDQFLAAHFRRREPASQPLVAQASVPGRRPPPVPSPAANVPPEPLTQPPPGPAPIENPIWLDLHRKRSELERRRSQLLVDRTPLHPDVQELNVEIANLEQRLAQTPRRVVPENANAAAAPKGKQYLSPAAGNPSQQNPAAPSVMPQGITSQLKVLKPAATTAAPGVEEVRASGEAARQYAALREGLVEAERLRDQAVEQERLALQRQGGSPPIEVQWADHAKPVGLMRQQVKLLTMSLLAGLVAAAGAGMLSAGFAGRNEPFTSPGQVEKALSIPVVGVISGEHRKLESDCRSTRDALSLLP